MWTTFVLVSSLVSTVHFGVMFGRVMALKPVQFGPA
jgi:cytochrome bd-type quinol oxidase subunit 2